MALETLKEVTSIGEFKVVRINWTTPAKNFIEICDNQNAITFKLQNGPIKENGVNGCQVDTIIEVAMMILEGLNDNFPCFENQMAINKLESSLLWLEKRKIDRGVEGENKI